MDPAGLENQNTVRLLSANILAGARIDSYREYFTRSWASILPTRNKQDNLHQLAHTLRQFDIIGLQESDAGSLRSGFINQTRFLAEVAGMPYWSYQPNRPLGRIAHTANGLISRMQPLRVIDHPLPGRIPGRGVLLATFALGQSTLAVAVAHLSLGAQARLRQLDYISELLADYPHAILMGDLNTDSNSREMCDFFAHSRLKRPLQFAPTFPSWDPAKAIDHILVSDGLEIKRCWTLRATASDHLPIAAEVQLPAAPSE